MICLFTTIPKSTIRQNTNMDKKAEINSKILLLSYIDSKKQSMSFYTVDEAA